MLSIISVSAYLGKRLAYPIHNDLDVESYGCLNLYDIHNSALGRQSSLNYFNLISILFSLFNQMSK